MGVVQTRMDSAGGNEHAAGDLARRAFAAALWFLLVVAVLGVFLRLQSVRPVPGANYSHFLHAHSHVAFLGWVFNAFFALALRHFMPPEASRRLRALFVVLQVAVIGMLVSFPLQGYGAVSITFSTLHLAGAAVLAWRLWHDARAAPAARGHLRAALVFLVSSGLGPLALGPLAALGWRDSPAYLLTIYYYLHFQYNGWFLFFLQAVLFQDMAAKGLSGHEPAARRALVWLAAGTVLTLAQSALWLETPVWVRVVAALGGLVQLVGCWHLLKALRGANRLFSGPALGLALCALGGFFLKHSLQAAAAWPALAGLMNHRFVVIGFLHLVFLVVVTPLLLAWGIRHGWLRAGRWLQTALILIFGGIVLTGLVHANLPLAGLAGWPAVPYYPEILLGASLLIAAGTALLLAPPAADRLTPREIPRTGRR